MSRQSFLILSILLLFATSLCGQTRYERKSISYVNALWTSTQEARQVKHQQVGYMLDVIKENIEMDRFDYNPLPESIISDFVRVANTQSDLTVEDVATLMEKHFVPKIVQILEDAQELRGQELLSAADKQAFLASKAKESGVTIEEIEKVMNAAYIYLPVLTEYKRSRSKEDENFYTYSIAGGIIWFHLDMSGDTPAVRRLVVKSTSSSGYGSDHDAYQSAVMNFARNLQVATQSVPDFLLKESITEVKDNGNIAFNLGIKEGLHVDDTYIVGEWEAMPDGSRKFVENGWVKVGKVANNRHDPQARSTAWPVKTGILAPGMQLKEHPRLSIDVAFKPMMYFTSIGEGVIDLGFDEFRLDEEFTDPAFGADIDFQMNLAPITEVSQLFLLVGGNFAIQPGLELSSNQYNNTTTNVPYIWGVHFGLMKKMYFRQLVFSMDTKIGARYYTFSQDMGLFDQYSLEVKNNTIGTQFDLGLEYAVSPDVNIGVTAGFRFFGISNSWDVTFADSDGSDTYTFEDASGFPEVNHSGLAVGLYLHYSPASLPFDPINLITGQ